jgi:bifunctional non-homologous end joining protein LigD
VVPGDGGRSSFQRLQNAFEAGDDSSIVYFVFDAPYLEGEDLTRLPLRARKERLKRKLPAAGPVRFSEHLAGNAAEVLEQACRLGLEGLIGKRADSVYVSGRTRDWIKLKCRRQQDFVIAGYTAPRGSRQGFGALVVGVHDERGKLHYAGKVGTGFDDAMLARLARRLAALRRKNSPFEEDPPREVARETTWVQPVLAAQVAFAERTDDGLLRQASFLGLREDMPAKQVGEEKAAPPPGSASGANRVLGVTISHPERPVWPALGITKLELARYYEEVGDWLLPHVKDRPLSLVRCPDGVQGKCFYQRHLKRKGAYMYAGSLQAVASFVQNGAVELHTWGATMPDIRRPDRITLDLDPDPALEWERLAEAARLVRALLEGLKLKCFLKTTGGKGLHVVAPVERGPGWDEVKTFTRALAGLLEKARPDLFTAKMSKARRGGRVFVDYLRNAETASAVCAYSARARPEATVSTPLAWDELGKADLRGEFTVRSVPRRLARLGADPWRDYAASRRRITAALRRSVGA